MIGSFLCHLLLCILQNYSQKNFLLRLVHSSHQCHHQPNVLCPPLHNSFDRDDQHDDIFVFC